MSTRRLAKVSVDFYMIIDITDYDDLNFKQALQQQKEDIEQKNITLDELLEVSPKPLAVNIEYVQE